MQTGKCDNWRYNMSHGLAGLALSAAILVAMRHEPAQALSLAVVITSTAGWTRRSVTDPGSDGQR
jgi:hypothetical protein